MIHMSLLNSVPTLPETWSLVASHRQCIYPLFFFACLDERMLIQHTPIFFFLFKQEWTHTSIRWDFCLQVMETLPRPFLAKRGIHWQQNLNHRTQSLGLLSLLLSDLLSPQVGTLVARSCPALHSRLPEAARLPTLGFPCRGLAPRLQL